MTNLELLSGVSAIAIITGLVHLARKLGMMEKYALLLTIALGELAAFGYYFYRNQTWYEAVIVGLVLGLSAVGLYAGPRETVAAFRQNK